MLLTRRTKDPKSPIVLLSMAMMFSSLCTMDAEKLPMLEKEFIRETTPDNA
jgi:hypothetical protein